MTVYHNKTYDAERALYGVHHAVIENCRFEGPADGESALKETAALTVKNCIFALRYPLWHTTGTALDGVTMTPSCRAALWYGRDVDIKRSNLAGIKAVRECDNVIIQNTAIVSDEFGWMCRSLTIRDSELVSEYPFLQTRALYLNRVKMKGKYSFQYTENVEIHHAELDTKDAFWHSKNTTVYDSVVKGEYLGWYSENLKLVRCKIIGTQPLCYAKGLALEDCRMIDCDLAFENSDVTAGVNGSILSVKNPASGSITADRIDEVIINKYGQNGTCKIFERAAEKQCVNE